MRRLVSIVIPTKNRCGLLAQAVESCLRQTYPAFELIIVDDGSTDGTGDYVRSLKDPRVVYVRRQVSRGSVAALNEGFALSSGEYLSWSSDDDLYAPDALAVLVEALEQDSGVDFVYAHYWMIDEQGGLLHPARVEDPQALDRDNYVGHCFLYRRKVYEAIGEYHPEPFLAEEYEYWLRVRTCFRMKRLTPVLYYHRVHAAALTSVHGVERMQDAVARARRAYIPAWKHHFFLAERYYHARANIKGLGHILLSLFLCPWHKPSWRTGILLILPQRLRSWFNRGGR